MVGRRCVTRFKVVPENGDTIITVEYVTYILY